MNISRNRVRLLMTGALVLGALIAAPAAHAQPASASSCSDTLISWSVVPATATAPDARTKYVYTNIPPGATISDHVAVFNRGCVSAAFGVYLTDATGSTTSGALTFLPANTKSTDIGAWTGFPGHVNQVSAIIAGGKGIIEPFTITVPSNATPGDHTGGMIAQVGVPHRTSTGQMVTLYQRIAIPVELRVAGPLTASLKVQNLNAGFSNPVNPFGTGSASVTYTVTNSGNVRLAGSQLVTVSGSLGGNDTIRPPVLPMVLPGDSIRVTVRAPGLYPAGPVHAKVSLTPQWPAKTTPLSARLTLASSETSLFEIPYATLVLLILFFGGGYGVWRYLRWRRRAHLEDLATVADQARRETERRLLGEGTSQA
jgi:hypothetical protein